MSAVKFLQSMDPDIYLELREVAKELGVSIQEPPPAVIIPDWMSDNRLPGSAI